MPRGKFIRVSLPKSWTTGDPSLIQKAKLKANRVYPDNRGGFSRWIRDLIAKEMNLETNERK